ncbi:amino acid adenylation domain-containing protein [Streptomyces sp. BK208]|uniref:non-ribosomal peptide synthetase n=1 Tax=Streptomyces sp. BK208 TaxID=2512150 RepID=UPI00105BD73E|nr:non-ribosomal peptide synthetase [Streptomyces sp. BK208]TDT22736.1 amino acid adenylation domain-containing protein [Streptomyces sp. BK208]
MSSSHPLVTVPEQIWARAKEHPERIAVCDDAGAWTYRELADRAGGLATALSEQGVESGSLVGVHLPRGREAVAALLAVWTVGGAYIPLDVAYPASRIDFMVRDSGLTVLVTTTGLEDGLSAVDKLSVIRTDLIGGPGQVAVRPPVRATQTGLAYVIYTSGSTGRPKGVMVEHRNLTNLVAWHGTAFGVSESDRCSHIASAGFDAAVWEMWPALAHGACLCVIPEDIRQSFDEVVEWCRTEQITVAFMPTALGEHFLRATTGSGTALRLLLTGGDELRMRPSEHTYTLVNNYGPTECTVVTTSTVVAPSLGAAKTDAAPPSIGRPIDGAEVFVVAPDGKLAGPGEPGELWVAGAGVARGYLGRPELTRERFVSAPFASRAYRTGDLVAWNSDGTLRFLGREDRQVKVRGQRIELGEIDAALLRLPQVKDCVTVVREAIPGHRQLVSYVVSDAVRHTPRDIRAALARELTAAMVPEVIVPLAELPLTVHGKIDHEALPDPEGFTAPDAPAEPSYPASDDPVLAELTRIFAEVLNHPGVEADSDFFDLGGHSVQLTMLLTRLRDHFGVELKFRDVLGASTPRLLADLVHDSADADAPGAARADVPTLVRRPDEDGPAILSSTQQQLWFLDQLTGRAPVFNVPIVHKGTGEVDVDALRWAVLEVVRRHEVLRTRFTLVDGVPVQTVDEDAAVTLTVIVPDGATGLDSAVADLVTAPFDLTEAPLMRAALVRGETEWALVFVLHHIVVDAWSTGVLLSEVGRFYRYRLGSTEPLPPEPPIRYRDFAVWQREWVQSKTLVAQREEWLAELADYPRLLELPGDRPRPVERTFAGAELGLRVPADLVTELERIGREHGATLFMTLLSAVQVVLGRWSGQERFLVGSPTAGRTRTETEQLIGFFVNTLVLPADLSANPTFRELIERVRDHCLAAFARQDVPFEQLVENAVAERNLAYNPLVQVLFILQSAPTAPLELPGARLERVHVPTSTSQFDLTLSLVPGTDGLTGSLQYSTERFSDDTMRRFTGHLLEVLRCLVKDPYRPIGCVDMLSEAEHAELTALGTGPRHRRERLTVADRIHRMSRDHPEQTAVVDDSGSWTFRELSDHTRTLAAALQRHGVERGKLVGVCLPRDRGMVAALLAVWATGAAYVPLDPDYPRARLEYMVRDSAVSVLLTTRELEGHVAVGGDTAVVLTDGETLETADGFADAAPAATPDDPAYVIYTSGSTGRPKGVVVDHRNLANLIESFAEDPGFRAEDRMLALTSLSFDIAGLELFLPLVTGGRLVVAPSGAGADPELLHRLIERHGITVVQATPSTWKLYTEHRDRRAPSALRQIWCGGEEMSERLGTALTGLGVARVWNVYGPTETTIWSTMTEVRPGDRGSIGCPVANTRVFVVDRAGRLVPRGVPGELLVAGDGVARGYLGRPDLTDERFVTAPDGGRAYRTGDLVRWGADGSLHYLGRLDHQVKIRGHRIELGEIDSLVRTHPGVQDALTLATPDAGGEQELVCYVVPASQPDEGLLDDVRTALAGMVPAYMVPSAWIAVEDFPLTANGKIDRTALPEPVRHGSTASEAPATPMETAIAAIWRDVLNVVQVSRNDDFFHVGGHSLSAMRVLTRVRDRIGARLELKDLFARPVLSDLAAHVDAVRRTADAPPTMGQRDRSLFQRTGQLDSE